MSTLVHETSAEGRFATSGNLEIYFRTWRPAVPPRGVLVIVPGFNSHSGYYADIAPQLTDLGLAVYALDLRGRGKSDGERFYVDAFSDYVTDVEHMVALARSAHAALPVFLLGHSAGGVVGCLFVLEHQHELAGFICESFAFEVPAPDFALAVFKGIAHVAPHAHVLHLKNEDFSRDPNMVARMNDDPLIAGESQPTRTLAEMVRADETLKRSFARITLPTLILHGMGDRATKASGSQFFFDHAGSPDKALRLYHGHYHDLLHDVGREKVMADVVAWLTQRLPPR